MDSVGIVGAGPKATSLIESMRNSVKVFSYDPHFPLELKCHQNKISIFKEPIGYFSPIGEMVKSVDAIFVCLSSRKLQDIVMDQIKECIPTYGDAVAPMVFMETEFEK